MTPTFQMFIVMMLFSLEGNTTHGFMSFVFYCMTLVCFLLMCAMPSQEKKP